MKYLLIALVLKVSFVSADIANGVRLVSFEGLQSSSLISNSGLTISLRGYLLFDEERLYFCSNMETCYSRGKNRVVIKSNKEIISYLRGVDNCHMELTGLYQSLGSKQASWPLLGYLSVEDKPEFDFNSNYSLINKRCKAFNVIFSE